MLLNVILNSVIAGAAGTCAGGLIAARTAGKSGNLWFLFSVAAGLMSAIVFFDLMPEALQSSGILSTVLSVCAGGAFVALADTVLRLRGKRNPQEKPLPKMMRTGILITVAIAVHDFPEGLVIGASESVGKGLFMAVLIGLHNVPEGIAVAAPLIAGGMKKGKAVAMTAATGIPSLLGALTGYWIGTVSEAFAGVSLGIAGGAMLAVTFCDMLPDACGLGGGKKSGYAFIGALIAGFAALAVFAH